MQPVELRTRRLRLTPPESRDIDLVTEYCQDPIFEAVMTLPWPYHRGDAQYFVEEHVPRGWADDTEYTWALRRSADGPLLGAIGWRAHLSMIGFWLGEPPRHPVAPDLHAEPAGGRQVGRAAAATGRWPWPERPR